MIEPLLSDDALLADVTAAERDAQSLHVWWLGQSGYLLAWGGRRALLDPYLSDSLTTKYATTEKPHVRMAGRVIDPARMTRIEFVTSTHSHTDHLDAQTLGPLLKSNPKMEMIAPRATLKLAEQRFGRPPEHLMNDSDMAEINGARVHAVPAAHDRLDRDDSGNLLYLGYVLKLGGLTIYHSGDTVVFDGMADLLRPFKIDVAILPINGKVGNMNGTDAARLAKAIGAKLVIPCHYDLFEFNTADPAEQFVPECERLGQPFRVLKLGERLTLG